MGVPPINRLAGKMELFDFYKKLLPEQGVYCLSEVFWSATAGKKICVNRGYNTLIELADKTIWSERNHTTSDIYFGVAAYKDLLTYDEVRQKMRFKRTNNNVRAAKNIYVDLDVKEGSFSSQKEAAYQMLMACDKFKWPFPMMVNSGNGVHCYWPLNKEIDSELYRRVLRAVLAKLGDQFGSADVDGLVDATRILRPIGTTNKKTTPPKLVTLLRDSEPVDFDYFLSTLGELPELSGGGVVEVGEPVGRLSAVQIITECEQIRECGLQTEPVWRAGLSVLRMCKNGRKAAHLVSSADRNRYTQEGTDQKLNILNQQQGVHGMPATCQLLNSLRPGICQRCKHWPSVMRGELKSPASLGKQVVTFSLASLPVLPAGYVRPTPQLVQMQPVNENNANPASATAGLVPPVNMPSTTPASTADGRDASFQWIVPMIQPPVDNIVVETSSTTRFRSRTPNNSSPELVGTVMIVHKGDNEEDVPIYMSRDVMVPVACYTNKTDEGNWEQSTVWRIYSRFKEGYNEVKIPNADLHGRDTIRKISSFGVTIENSKHFVPFGECLRGLLTNARSLLPMLKEYDHLGWIDDSTFSLGNVAYQRLPNGTVAEIQLSTNESIAPVANYVHPEGRIEDWVAAFDIFGKPGNEYMGFAALATFGSPLMRFTNQGGVTISVVTSESGTGKSTMQRVSMAAWGDPKGLVKHQLGPSSGITPNAFMSFLGIIHSLPAEIDELSKMPDDQIGGLLYTISSGEERQRANSSGKIRLSTGKWRNLTVVSSNKSLRDQIAAAEMRETDAMLKRLIELTPPAKVRKGTDWIQSSAILDKVGASNYGLAGNIYAKFLVANVPILRQKIQEKFRYLVERANGDQSERFWFAAVACIFVGAELAQVAGLHHYDIKRFEEWFFDVLLPDMRGDSEAAQIDYDNILGDILTDHLRETLVVKQAVSPTSEAAKIGYAVRMPMNSSVYVRAEIKERRAFISTEAIRKWAARNKYQYSSVIKAFEQTGVLVDKKARIFMGKGVPGLESVSGSRLRCVEVMIDPEQLLDKTQDGVANGTENANQV